MYFFLLKCISWCKACWKQCCHDSLCPLRHTNTDNITVSNERIFEADIFCVCPVERSISQLIKAVFFLCFELSSRCCNVCTCCKLQTAGWTLWSWGVDLLMTGYKGLDCSYYYTNKTILYKWNTLIGHFHWGLHDWMPSTVNRICMSVIWSNYTRMQMRWKYWYARQLKGLQC